MNELISIERGNLTPTEFQGLAEVPPELEWFVNIDNGTGARGDRR
jgi:hypothetical protein